MYILRICLKALQKTNKVNRLSVHFNISHSLLKNSFVYDARRLVARDETTIKQVARLSQYTYLFYFSLLCLARVLQYALSFEGGGRTPSIVPYQKRLVFQLCSGPEQAAFGIATRPPPNKVERP